MRMLALAMCFAASLVAVAEAGQETTEKPTQQKAFIAFAVERGLSEVDAEALWADLMSDPWRTWWFPEKNERWGSDKIDVVPILIEVDREWDLPRWSPDSEESLSQTVVHAWLGLMRDERGAVYLLERIRGLLAHGIRSNEEYYRACASLVPLGSTRWDEALDFLFKVQSRSFWEGPDAPVVDMPPVSGAMTAEERTRCVQLQMSVHALEGLSWSGTARVLRAFATGEGLDPLSPERLDRLFEFAARMKVGIFFYPELGGRPLREHHERNLKAVYEEYGKPYVPREVIERDPDRREHW